MTYTGIINSKVSSGEYKVRIPELNKVAGAIGATPDSELYTARVATSCGIWPDFKSGDKVFIAFLTFGSGSPVILGLQFNEASKERFSSAHFTDLEVSVNSKLPQDTSIGEVTSDNIKCLINLTTNIASKFTELDETNTSQGTTLTSHLGRIEQAESRLDTAETNISTLGTDVGSLSSTLNGLSSTLSTLSNSFATHEINNTIHVTSQQKTNWDRTYTQFTSFYQSGKIILTSDCYGTTLPSVSGPDAPQEGQLFFVIQQS